jgi:GNAT superfamily N-acetyltransferase
VGIYAVATLPKVRGKGYGAALTARAVQTDATLPAVLQASDDGQPVYLRLGFQIVVRYALWMRQRAQM